MSEQHLVCNDSWHAANERFIRFAQSELQKRGFYAGTIDGLAGDLTKAAFLAALGAPSAPASKVVPVGAIDERSAKNIATLNPKVRPAFEALTIEGTRIAREFGADSYILIVGNRSYEEQDALYAKGRTAPGPKVTNAKGGESYHNFGVAGDFGVFRQGSYLDANEAALASKVHKAVAAWAKANLPELTWGGSWTSFRDEPHFEYRTGLSLSEMRDRLAKGKPIL